MDGVSPAFTHTIRTLYGEAGDTWLASLQERLRELADLWDLRIGEPYAALSYHYVCRAARRANGEPVVLKLGLPGDSESTPMESAALRVYGGKGIARLLAADLSRGAMLLECVRPGTPLSAIVVDAISDERATRILAAVMHRILRPLPDPSDQAALVPLSHWTREFESLRVVFREGREPFPRPLFDQASQLYSDLMASQREIPYLLHADLHHDNILDSSLSRGADEPWIAIDPKGVAGDPAFEVTAMLHNPLGRLWSLPDTKAILNRRLDTLSDELVLPRERLQAWGIVQSVISAWWSLSDGLDGWQEGIRIAELLCEPR